MNAKELYPQDGHYISFGDYNPIIKSFGNVVVQVDDSDYQGDSRILYNEGGKIGYLKFGWGSCSGCDALQACNTYADVDQLIGELRDQVIWFDTPAECLAWFENHDWAGDYDWHSEETKSFIEQVKTYLVSL